MAAAAAASSSLSVAYWRRIIPAASYISIMAAFSGGGSICSCGHRKAGLQQHERLMAWLRKRGISSLPSLSSLMSHLSENHGVAVYV